MHKSGSKINSAYYKWLIDTTCSTSFQSSMSLHVQIRKKNRKHRAANCGNKQAANR